MVPFQISKRANSVALLTPLIDPRNRRNFARLFRTGRILRIDFNAQLSKRTNMYMALHSLLNMYMSPMFDSAY